MVRCGLLDRFFLLTTWLGSLAVLLPATGGIAVWMARNAMGRECAFLLLAMAGAVLVSHTLKRIVSRPRPRQKYVLLAMPGGWSFPSAHTAQITAFCLGVAPAVWQQAPGLRLPVAAFGAVLTLVVGASRVYLQVHYLSDVVAGAVLSGVWVTGLHLVFA